VKQSELLLFTTSILTVLGIAFFAQWSILSNITSGLILFFNHPLRIGDTIKIIDKEQPVEGVIQDISYFFLHLKTNDNDIVTIPNSMVMQKSFLIKPAK
jgi:small-conductance mechanosensitive channel